MKKVTKTKAIRAYKVFNPDWICRDFQFQVGKHYAHKGSVRICQSGFHACLQVADCFSYYDFNSNNKVAEVLLWGETNSHDEDTKICASNIEIIREISWQEVLVLANTGKDCTGLKNSGNGNSGYGNSGYGNSGNRNSGVFCEKEPFITCFDVFTKLRYDEFNHPDLSDYQKEIWIYSESMSDTEKQLNPSHETCGGYLKSLTDKEMWQNGWNQDSDENKLRFFQLPNFDLAKFERITQIDAKADYERLANKETN